MKYFKLVYLTAGLAAALWNAVPALAACENPVGGSEHSVGLPSPVYQGIATAFAESPVVMAQEAVLHRHAYCAVAYEPSVTRTSPACTTDALCVETFAVSLLFEGPLRSQPRTVSGTYRTYLSTTGSESAHFVADPLDTTTFGKTTQLNDADSGKVMAALAGFGLTDTTGLLGVDHLFAGEIRCDRAVAPEATAECAVTSGEKEFTASVEDAATLNDILLRAGALVDDGAVGVEKAAASLVTCSRVVYPGAIAHCSLLIEN